VAPGDYRVLVRHGGVLSRCEVSAAGGTATVELDRCPSEPILAATSKGGLVEPARRLRIELTGIAGGERKDGFTSTLGAFGYKQSGGPAAGLALSATRQIDRRLWLGGFAALVGSPEWTLPTERKPLRFSWNVATLGVLVRAFQPLGDHGLWARTGLYGQLGAGLGLGSTQLTDQDDMRTAQHFFGWAMAMGAGLHIEGNRLGFSLGYEFDYAPVIDNLTGDTHASGGHRLSAGVSYAY
jgi:hypothetical protein